MLYGETALKTFFHGIDHFVLTPVGGIFRPRPPTAAPNWPVARVKMAVDTLHTVTSYLPACIPGFSKNLFAETQPCHQIHYPGSLLPQVADKVGW